MYFFRLGKLTNDLKKNLIDQNGAIKYLVGVLVLSAIGQLSGVFSFLQLGINPIFLIMFAFLFIFYLIFLIFSFVIFYSINASGDNKNFLVRYFSLSFVIDIYFVILTIPSNLLHLSIKFYNNPQLADGPDIIIPMLNGGIALYNIAITFILFLVKIHQWRKIAEYTRNQARN